VCAGGAENSPTLAPVLTAELEPTAFGTVNDTAVWTGENIGACCSGGVGYKYQNVVNISNHNVCRYV